MTPYDGTSAPAPMVSGATWAVLWGGRSLGKSWAQDLAALFAEVPEEEEVAPIVVPVGDLDHKKRAKVLRTRAFAPMVSNRGGGRIRR